MAGDTVIDVKDLVRVYKSSTGYIRKKRKEILAVDHISFKVSRGELFGLVGPNGAGKTTTIKMLTTLLLPTSGNASILGFDVVRQPVEIRRRIGLVFGGERGLYYRITGRQNLKYFADLYGVAPGERDKRVQSLLDLVGLADRADERVEDYSRGMKQRLHVAKGLINDPELIFMDEPTIGLDPQAARDTREMIKEFVAQGRTIVLTTHYMFEADELCNRVGVITRGKIVALDSPTALKRLVKDTSVIEVEAFGLTDKDVDAVRGVGGVRAVSANLDGDKQVLRVQVSDPKDSIGPLSQVLRNGNVIDMKIKEPTLEDAYLWLVEGNA